MRKIVSRSCVVVVPAVRRRRARRTRRSTPPARRATGVNRRDGAATATECAAHNVAAFYDSGALTVGTDNPVFPPWFAGTGTYADWTAKPSSGTGTPQRQGFESAVAYEVADAARVQPATRSTGSPVELQRVLRSRAPSDFDFVHRADLVLTHERDAGRRLQRQLLRRQRRRSWRRRAPRSRTRRARRPEAVQARGPDRDDELRLHHDVIQPDQQPAGLRHVGRRDRGAQQRTRSTAIVVDAADGLRDTC